MTAQEQRMYYLMLSPSQGQEFSKNAGFPPPSEDVQEAETHDVIARWALLTSTGILEDALITTDWLLDIEAFDEIDDDMREQLQKLFVAHSLSLVNKLLDSDKAALIALIDMEDDYDD